MKKTSQPLTQKQLNAVLRRLEALKDGSATKFRKRPRNRVAVQARWKAKLSR